MKDVYKLVAVGLGAFLVGRFTGVHHACHNPEICDMFEKYQHFRPGMMVDGVNPILEEYAVDKTYREGARW